MRVVSDHVRAVAFSIADGQLPSNVKAGYVIRRILRRAIRYGYTFLNVKQPFIYKLIDTLIKTLGDHYSDLNKQKDLIEDVIRQEEVSFLKTLDSGLKRLDNILQNNSKITGNDVFELYDTYGFPKDLTSLILQEKNIKFDDKEFELEMQKQKNRSKKSSAIDYGEWTIVSNSENESFVGYDKSISTSQITRYRSVSIKDEIKYHIVLEETPFYPEGGGQVGDSGHLKYSDANIEVLNTIKENNLIYHVVNNLPKDLKSKCDAIINENRRKSISRNHTATHLLHLELRNMLGDHVMQKGSLVDESYFRFDFSHHNALSRDLLEKIEQNVNATILKNILLNEKTNVSLSDAEEMGALMLFGEKYDEKVRVIQFGESIELCGGTHVGSTSEIGLFKIVSESSVASGIRRIEARTGISAFNLLNDSYQKSRNLETLLKTKDISSAIDKLLNDNKTLEIKNQKSEFEDDPQKEIEAVSEIDDEQDIRRIRKPRQRRYKIQEVIKVRQIMLVQVVKEERGNKGAALTTYLSLAGRYCVLMPNTARGGGISRKITNLSDRKKLKEIANEIDVPLGAGLIVRTAGAKRTKSEIKRDYEYLQRLWEQIRELTLKSIAPSKIYEEGDLIKRSIRDLYNRDIDEVLVEGERGYQIAKDFMKMILFGSTIQYHLRI